MDQETDNERLLGLHVLHSGLNPTVDIVAVHGLGANPKYAWIGAKKQEAHGKINSLEPTPLQESLIKRTIAGIPIVRLLTFLLKLFISLFLSLFLPTKKRKPQEGERIEVNWLRQLLPHKVPNARIMTFNYVSRWHKNAPRQTWRSCSDLLLDSLLEDRRKMNIAQRPLIFVGHSFGGNVIELMIVTANSRDDTSFIAKDTTGVIFLGTPHRGSAFTHLAELVVFGGAFLGLNPENSILEDLKTESRTLDNVRHDFSVWVFRTSAATVCFFEQFETDYGAKIGSSWKGIVVDKQSACLDISERFPLPRDHLKLNKYTGEDDPCFVKVSDHIQRIAEGSHEIIYRRYNPRPNIVTEEDLGITGTQRNCLRLLGEIDPADDFSAIRREKRQTTGTSEWLLSLKEYTTWVSSRGSNLLRLEGSAGIGKTVLAAFLVKELQEKAQHAPDMTFAYYFCDYKDKRKTASSILQGWILQLLRQHKLFKHLPWDFESKEKEHLTFDTLWEILVKHLANPKLGNVFLLVDALDECEMTSRRQLLASLRELFKGDGVARCKLLITCRPETDIKGELGDISNCVAVDSGIISPDVEKFICTEVPEIATRYEWGDSLGDKVQNALTKHAEGTFLWASLVLQELKETDKDLIEGKLDHLPDNLDKVYERILLGISRDVTAPVLLQILVASRRPLTRRELAVAYALTSRGKENATILSEDEVEKLLDIYTVCKHLVYLDKNEQTVNFIHQSARDYVSNRLENTTDERLKKYHIRPDWAHLTMLKICWMFLSMNKFDGGEKIISRGSDDTLYWMDLSLESNYFLKYASQEWLEHALMAKSALVERFELDKAALDKATTLRDAWLLRAATEGQVEVVKQLLDRGATVNSKDHRSRTALSHAAERGHEAVVELLLAKDGVEADSRDNGDRTPLMWAAKSGKDPVVRLLLTREQVDPNSKDEYRLTPLGHAVKSENQTTVRLLLENSKVQPKAGRSPVWLAKLKKNETILQLLLAKGRFDLDSGHIDPNSKDNYGQTPLLFAIETQDEAAVEVLLADSATDPNYKDGLGRTPLLMAIDRGYKAFVWLLLTSDSVDANSTDSYGRTPLWLAIEHGMEAVVDLLLERGGLDPNYSDKYGRTPLWLAIEKGSDTLVDSLLERGGLDPNYRDNFGRTPLWLAEQKRSLKSANLLREKGGIV